MGSEDSEEEEEEGAGIEVDLLARVAAQEAEWLSMVSTGIIELQSEHFRYTRSAGAAKSEDRLFPPPTVDGRDDVDNDANGFACDAGVAMSDRSNSALLDVGFATSRETAAGENPLPPPFPVDGAGVGARVGVGVGVGVGVAGAGVMGLEVWRLEVWGLGLRSVGRVGEDWESVLCSRAARRRAARAEGWGAEGGGGAESLVTGPVETGSANSSWRDLIFTCSFCRRRVLRGRLSPSSEEEDQSSNSSASPRRGEWGWGRGGSGWRRGRGGSGWRRGGEGSGVGSDVRVYDGLCVCSCV